VSCKTTSILEFDKRIPVKPPKVNKKMNPFAHSKGTEVAIFFEPYNLANQLKILTPVGTAIVIVAAVK
jgi:hypothetical protein